MEFQGLKILTLLLLTLEWPFYGRFMTKKGNFCPLAALAGLLLTLANPNTVGALTLPHSTIEESFLRAAVARSVCGIQDSCLNGGGEFVVASDFSSSLLSAHGLGETRKTSPGRGSGRHRALPRAAGGRGGTDDSLVSLYHVGFKYYQFRSFHRF